MDINCPKCGAAITRQSVDQILQDVLNLPEGERVMILAPGQLSGEKIDLIT